MPGILPMKVIKVGSSAQSRIAQAWYVPRMTFVYLMIEHVLIGVAIVVVQKRFDVMGSDRMLKQEFGLCHR